MWRPSFRTAVFLAMLALALAYLLQLVSLAAPGDATRAGIARQTDDVESRRLASNAPAWSVAQLRITPTTPLSDENLRLLAGLSNKEQFLRLVQPILIPRVSGTPGNLLVQQHIIQTLRSIGYTIETDSFQDTPPAPHSRRTFTNIIATLDPNAPRRLVLACHFDSKFDNRGEFIGATDSAVPCAMLLDLAATLRGHVDSRPTKSDITLQLLFLDGEEAFGEWSSTDSLYGARHLSAQLQQKRNRFAPGVPNLSELSSMDLFVLLDLIGTTDTQFVSFYPETAAYYTSLAGAEDRLSNMRLIKQWGRSAFYFGRTALPLGSSIDDDHRPFKEKGVKIVHLISYPFPSVWHQYSDNEANIHYQTVDDINKIMRVFVCEYLSCRF
ncbi:Glutaminyl-peptide cyclotransferase [Hypsibius exemplaris]|uniref:Glutaminyl-peptide cyclotransferase n=1 Tax=Hypsibius exemplaris TaxID=2072580 RepID=A0A1W0W8D3_HYPEX|nr:Glutaminyl-peptide cyclotransferase [Hypsibius exemplaris]